MPHASTEPSPGGERGDRGVPRLCDVEAELRMRLRAVCGDWQDGEFDALVRHMARTKVAWAEARRLD